MIGFSRCGLGLALIAWLGTCLPWQAIAQEVTPHAATRVIDVKLDETGRLVGSVVDEQRNVVVHVPVALLQNGQYVASVTTDEQGQFAFSSIKGGMYALTAGATMQPIRVWTADLAPPGSCPVVSLTTSTHVALGQGPMGIGIIPLACLGMSATALALSIALPLILNDDEDDDDAS